MTTPDQHPEAHAQHDGPGEVEGHRPQRHVGGVTTCGSGSQGKRRDRGAQGHQGGGVVDQRLALEDRHDPPGQADASRDRGGRDGVRGRHDRAQRECHREGHTQEPVGDQADAAGGEQHQPHGQAEDREPVGPEVHERRADRGGIQQGREEADEDDLRAQLGLGDERHVADRHPHDQQHEGCGHPQPLGEPRDEDDGPDDGDDRAGGSHRLILAGTWSGQHGQVSSPSTAARRVSSPTPPRSSARRWKSLSENASPSRSATWSRSCIQSRSPIL